MVIQSRDGQQNSLQITKMIIPSGTYISQKPFLVKNDSESTVDVTVTLASGEEVTTKAFPGWNPELCTKIVNPPLVIKLGY